MRVNDGGRNELTHKTLRIVESDGVRATANAHTQTFALLCGDAGRLAQRTDALHEIDERGDLLVGALGLSTGPRRIHLRPGSSLQRRCGVGQMPRALLRDEGHEWMQ